MIKENPMAENTTLENINNSSQLMRERLLWAIKPFGFMALLLWVADPASAGRIGGTYPLLAFVLGVLYGLAVYGPELKKLVIDRLQDNTRDQRNRLPEEYYWGEIETELATWK
jgi:hypothetical protein